MRFAITGTDGRFPVLRELLVADGHEITGIEDADIVIPPPWDAAARYARREEYQIANAGLTAEGAAALLRGETELAGKRALLLGYGRIGRLLAGELAAAGADVTVAARSAAQRAWAEAVGFAAVPLDALGKAAARADIAINTIPAPVLTAPLLERLPEGALLLELASAPGGIDAAAAEKMPLRYLRAPGLPAKYAPERAAVILRDAVYAAAAEPLPRLGVAVTGSHCTFSRALDALEPLRRDYTLVPILSGAAAQTDTRFFSAGEFRDALETLCGSDATDTIVKAEPLGTALRLDALLVVPCTGNTLSKLAHGITDTAVTMACKAHLRNGAPLILAISTNDGLSGSAGSIAALLQRKNVYFVPFRQDAPHQKPYSLQSEFDLLGETVSAALRGRQLQPVLL